MIMWGIDCLWDIIGAQSALGLLPHKHSTTPDIEFAFGGISDY